MDGGDVFPAEMPDDDPEPMVPTLMVPLDDDTAERLLAGRLHPEDAPPGYAEVARVLRAAAGPASPEELAGREAALAGFRAARDGPGLGRAEGHVVRAPMRARLAALALAGVLIAGGALTGGGVWIADGALTALGLRSPSGGPSTGGPGSGTPGSGSGAAAAGGSGSLRPVTNPVAGGRAPSLPSAGERAAARHGRGVTSRGGGSTHGVTSRGGGSAHGARPGTPAKPPKAGEDKAGEDKAGEDKAGKAEPPTAQKAKPPKAEQGPGGAPNSKPANPGRPWPSRAGPIRSRAAAGETSGSA
jgi:hypothetical protein